MFKKTVPKFYFQVSYSIQMVQLLDGDFDRRRRIDFCERLMNICKGDEHWAANGFPIRQLFV